MNTKLKGNIGEIKVISKLIELGYSVSIPFGDNERYDFIVEINSILYKVQVKSRTLKNNIIKIPLYSSSLHRTNGIKNKYTKNEIDLFIVYCPETNDCYLIKDFHTNDLISLRINETQNNQVKNINFAKDFLLENLIKTL